MKRVLVTGAAGFVGANLARRLIRDGHDVHLVVSPSSDCWRLDDLTPGAQIHAADLADSHAVQQLVSRTRPQWLFHLAAHGAYSWQTDVRRMIDTNLIGTINLVDAATATGFEVLVNTGSSSEYGFKDHPPSEEERVDPNSPYAITKVSATHYCQYVARSRGVRIATLRLYSVYGPWEEPNRLIPTLILRGLRGELPALVSPETARDYVYVDDVVEAYLIAAQSGWDEPGAVFNVGSGVQTSLRQVVAGAVRELGIAVEPVWGSMPGRIWDSDVWVSDVRKIDSVLAWRPRHRFDEGFRKTVDWFRSYPNVDRWYRLA